MTDRMKGAVWDKYFILDDKSPSGLTWKESRGTVKAGSAAGSVLKSARTSYYITRVMRIGYLVHRIIFEMKTGREIPPGMQIDHIDGNGLNNSFGNLRLVSSQINCRNKRLSKAQKNGGTTLPNGVALCSSGKGYTATIYDLCGKRKSRYFGIKKHGESDSLRKAAEWRAWAIEELNKLGAGYTSNHGSVRK